MSKAHNSQISRRYAEALYNAVPHSEQSNVLDEFKKVIIILGDAKIKDVFYHPRTSRKRKNELIDLMGLSKILSDFLKLIVEKSRGGLGKSDKKTFCVLPRKSKGRLSGSKNAIISLAISKSDFSYNSGRCFNISCTNC